MGHSSARTLLQEEDGQPAEPHFAPCVPAARGAPPPVPSPTCCTLPSINSLLFHRSSLAGWCTNRSRRLLEKLHTLSHLEVPAACRTNPAKSGAVLAARLCRSCSNLCCRLCYKRPRTDWHRAAWSQETPSTYPLASGRYFSQHLREDFRGESGPRHSVSHKLAYGAQFLMPQFSQPPSCSRTACISMGCAICRSLRSPKGRLWHGACRHFWSHAAATAPCGPAALPTWGGTVEAAAFPTSSASSTLLV